MKTWLKGGLIGVGVSLVLIIYYLIWINFICPPFSGECGIGAIFWYLAYFPISYIISYILLPIANIIPQRIGLVFLFIAGTVEYFLIGSLIGLIIQKIKK